MIRRRQRGIALLVAIVMFALATTVAAAITYSKAMTARRAAATFTMEEALQAGMAAEALASIVLEDNASASKTTLDQDWAKPLGPLEIEGTGVWIQAQLEDLSGRFNLNSVVRWDATANDYVGEPKQVDRFKKLLHDLGLEDKWADLLVDWIDPNIAPTALGGEDTLYLAQNPPYRPPNTYITHPSELLALPGFGAERYAKLAPYVTALPTSALVNVCTASGLVLDSRNDPVSQTEYSTQDLATPRKTGCYPLQSAYLAGTDPSVRDDVTKLVTEKSDWFRLRTNIRVGTAEFVLYSVLLRDSGSGNKVRVTQRSFGSE